MKKTIAFVLLLGGLAVFYYQFSERARQSESVPEGVEPPWSAEQQEPDEPLIRHPIPEVIPQTEVPPATDTESQDAAVVPETVEPAPESGPVLALPGLDESDGPVVQEFARLFPGREFGELFYPEAIIRRFVVTVDNLPREKLPRSKYIFVRPVGGRFLVTGEDDPVYIETENYRRYTPFVALVDAIEPSAVVAVYARLYPLFQQAYEDLGYPTAYFNDRMIDVIDHLLATPEVAGPIRLVRPRVLYQFADPALESLSAGQKILLRIGPDNAALIKAKLRELRQALASE